MTSMDKLIGAGSKFFDDLMRDQNARYLSWEHCYIAFKKCIEQKDRCQDEGTIDYLSLHLAFYLASWGMYRGSTFLLQQDYKVHIPIIKEILNPKYVSLLGIDYQKLKDPEQLDLLMGLKQELKRIYAPIRKKVYENNNKDTVEGDISNILISKILLGTLGCSPAYDQLFCKGIRAYYASTGVFNKNSIIKLCEFYDKNISKFEEFKAQLAVRPVLYPDMKILDMCFWQIGFDINMKK